MLNGVVESCPEADAIQMFCTRQWNKSIVNRFPGTYIAKFSQAHVIANMLIGAYIIFFVSDIEHSQTLSVFFNYLRHTIICVD